MASKMLIDAAHTEETRVVVVRGNRIEEFDYESTQRKQLKGNIYLAKVTRVEPSLQAAFVDYGGNRHGFLAFSEIHPDYYQIPVADRQALLEEEEEEDRRSDEEFESGHDSAPEESAADTDTESSDTSDDGPLESEAGNDGVDPDASAEAASEEPETDSPEDVENGERDTVSETVDSVGAEDALEEVPQRQRRQRRNYKIQEVIKRRQVILVQVVKEERGNKGAALTTYLSLAGRYCVLMPNTARGGGISRKITDATDRRRLKDVAKDTKVPAGMGLIVRTAGAQHTKAEIKRDFDYLMRLWSNVRDLTLESTAPALVYEEGSLIKRSIRDLYTKDVDEVLVEGEEAAKEAKGFMKMLMPSHARHVKLYKETQPLFSKYKVEGQLDGLFSNTVTLQSGGYMVMNQTEALVAIDINSGKATREHNIEDTALKTNIEASQEIARQLRLRDLAGLIVIDFIDMEEKRNNRSVERKLKDALKNDRARIQVGRISHFGLLEMSRQRLRQGMIENTSLPCPVCAGRGQVRSVSNCALSILRSIEEHLISKKPGNLIVRCEREVAFYILNDKRDHLLSLESEWGVSIYIEPSSELLQADCVIESSSEQVADSRKRRAESVKIDSAFEADEEAGGSAEAGDGDSANDSEGEDQGRKRKRRRGRRGGRRSRERASEDSVAAADDADQGESQPSELEAAESDAAEDGDNRPKKKPRKRSRKPKAEKAVAATSEEAETHTGDSVAADEQGTAEADSPPVDEPADSEPENPKRARKPRKSRKQDRASDADADATPAAEEAGKQPDEAEQAPTAVENGDGHEPEQEAPQPARTWSPPSSTTSADAPAKTGWWSRR